MNHFNLTINCIFITITKQIHFIDKTLEPDGLFFAYPVSQKMQIAC
jgi:hypothetical protein